MFHLAVCVLGNGLFKKLELRSVGQPLSKFGTGQLCWAEMCLWNFCCILHLLLVLPLSSIDTYLCTAVRGHTLITLTPLQNKKGLKDLGYPKKSSLFTYKRTAFFFRYPEFFRPFLFWSGFSISIVGRRARLRDEF